MKSYKYVDGIYQTTYEIKHSKFIATVCGEVDDDAESFVKSVKKKYPDATHNCYAYVADIDGRVTRFSDDGEPSGTAGQPILEVLKKKNLVATAVVVTRYFGGIKLGAGGLVSAYTEAAVQGIENAVISQKFESKRLTIRTDYNLYAIIEKYIRRKEFVLEEVDYIDGVTANFWVMADGVEKALADISEITAGKVKAVVGQTDFIKY